MNKFIFCRSHIFILDIRFFVNHIFTMEDDLILKFLETTDESIAVTESECKQLEVSHHKIILFYSFNLLDYSGHVATSSAHR